MNDWERIPAPKRKPEPAEHWCRLPLHSRSRDWDKEGEMAKCNECGRWSVFARDEYGDGGYIWQPVRWYNFGLKRRIRAHHRLGSSA